MFKNLARFTFILIGLAFAYSSQAGHFPNQLNLELLPVTMSVTHPRGIGFGFSIEKWNQETESITAMHTELSFPMFQNGTTSHIDWNGGFTLMTRTTQTFFVGAKVGVTVNSPDKRHSGFMALSIRLVPKDQSNFGFFQWVTRQLDLGVCANKNLYAAIRFGFSLL